MTTQFEQNTSLISEKIATPSWLYSFQPRRGLSNAHLQTIIGNFLPRPALQLPVSAETVLVDPTDNSRILCHCSWQPEQIRAQCLTVVLIHGLEGSSASGYIQGVAGRAWDAGWNVIRMNMRNCGGTEELTPTLYHSGLSGDVAAIVQHYAALHGLERIAVVGYSMGGNLALGMAGRWGTGLPLCAVATVCPAIDLSAGSDALQLLVNRPYSIRFLRGLIARFQRKALLFPHIYSTDGVGPIRSLREFDEKIVARYCNFLGAEDYYYRCSAARVIDTVTVPTLILQAKDDPFIRVTAETRVKIEANPYIAFAETQHGGHCAYLSRDRGNDIRWAEAAVVRFLTEVEQGQYGS